jgi:hypothetical protein
VFERIRGLEKYQEDAWPLQLAKDGDLHSRLKHKIVFQKNKTQHIFWKAICENVLNFSDLSDLLGKNIKKTFSTINDLRFSPLKFQK